MERIQLEKNLFLDEYIPEEVYKLRLKEWGQSWIDVLIRKINPKLIESDQYLRDRFGAVYINTWWNGGDHTLSGVRFPGYKPYKSSDFSDHFQGNASDKTFPDYPAEEIREWLKKSTNWKKAGVSIIEAKVNWLHTSVAWIPNQKLLKIV